MKPEILTLKQAQRLILASQKLIGPVPSPIEIIEHLGYVQIDTISVVERAHHHIFWARRPKYQPSDLDNLVSSRKVFEHWSHAASFLPMKDYRYSLPIKKEFKYKDNILGPRDPKLMKEILKRVKEEGPLRSKDFKQAKGVKNSGWWDWKPAKKALERLFLEGELEVTRREGFQKVYDLPERVIPSAVDKSFPTKKEYIRFLIKRTLRHHGVATSSEVGYLQKKNIKDAINKEFKEMLYSGEVVQVSIQGITEFYYMTPDSMNSLPRVSPKILILSPFDNMIIQRKKLKRFFNFDYQIECYVPAAKRKYGYFSLPVFSRALPFARIDCKVDREGKKLLVQSMHYEKNVDRDFLKPKLQLKLNSFARFNNCQKVVL